MERRKVLVSGNVNGLDGLRLELLLAPAFPNLGESQFPQVNVEGILIVIGERVQSLLARREETEILLDLFAVLRPADGNPCRELIATAAI